jgi:type I restriction enzyme, S subunit
VTWARVPLGEVFTIARGGSPRPIDAFITDDPDGVNWIMIGDATEGSKYISKTKKRILKEGVSRSRTVKPGDLLLTNSMSFGHPYILDTSGCIHDGWLVLSPRHDNVNQDYFYHLLGSPLVYAEFARLAAGAVVKNLNSELVRGVRVPLPPIAEQRRIADILDKAAAIRRKRKAVIGLADDLLHSVFLEVFGDPVTNPKGWPVKPLRSLVATPLRNGLSPASGGRVEALVLTLSAITRGRFDATAVKTGRFDVEPWDDVRVDERDFLICRGNGNISLVGNGAFPHSSMNHVVFPDTMIAARVDQSRILPVFLSTIWKSALVRYQIEAGARTTNGTFKINQGLVESVAIPCPPISEQRAFADIAARVSRSGVKLRNALRDADVLFNALVARAFSGSLEVAC